MNITIKKNQLIALLFIGIALRFAVTAFGYNTDFEAYWEVGEISGNFRNVYANTIRYNYGPIFFVFQGLFYRISQIDPAHWLLIFRLLIVSLLTATDLGITAFIAKRHGITNALAFFLNPVSIIITGYHNQFDNIAILFALISVFYFNKEKNLNKKDACFILFFTISLIMKHIMFIFPLFILVIHGLSIKKKIILSYTPPFLFLLSFVPFALSGKEAFYGILNNVFLYRSSNNAPLLAIPYAIIHFPEKPRFIVYCTIMALIAYQVRKLEFEQIILIYLLSMVTFSSAIANQYLAIPMVSLCILNVGIWDKIYMIVAGIYLCLEGDGLGLLSRIVLKFYEFDPNGEIYRRMVRSVGYVLATWILFFALVSLYQNIRKQHPYSDA